MKKRSRKPAPHTVSQADARKLIHELQVHQVELELQNEELRQARQQNDELLAKYTDLYEQAPTGYATLSRSGEILQINLTGASLLGQERSRLTGKGLSLLFVPECRPAFAAFLKNVFAGVIGQACELALSGAGAQGRVLRLSAGAWSGGEDCRIWLEDCTERGRIASERRLLASQLQQAQKMQALGQLAGGMAHDFNNMLAVIAGYCKLMRDEVPAEGVLGIWLSEVQATADKAAVLTGQLLTLSSKHARSQALVSPDEAIGKLSAMLRSVLGERIRLELRLAAPAAGIRMDPAQFEQAVLNLALNARDAMPKGGKLVIETAELALPQASDGLPPGDFIRISVSDTGVGIPKELQSRVFEPFFTTKAMGHGVGLGLSMVYGSVKQQGGEVFLHSQPGAGTTVRLFFKREAEPARPAASALRGAPAPGAGRGERVLLVEDEPRLRKMMAAQLSRSGYAVTAAASGEEALRLMAVGGGFALVVSDVVMPDLDGVELASRLRQDRPELPIIFCSGYADDMVKAEGIAGPAIPLFTKPVDIERMLKKMRELLEASAR